MLAIKIAIGTYMHVLPIWAGVTYMQDPNKDMTETRAHTDTHRETEHGLSVVPLNSEGWLNNIFLCTRLLTRIR